MIEHATQTATLPRPFNRLLSVVDALIAILILVLPFVMGGRQAWGHWLLISTSLALGTTWCVFAALTGARYRICWMELFLLAGLGIAWFQVQPLPTDTLQQFSAEYERLLPVWPQTQPDPNTARWQTVSLTPSETRHAWWVFLAYAIVLIVVFQRIRSQQDAHRLLKTVAVAGLCMTGFALLQWFTSNGRFFWFYEHPFTDPTVHLKGAFTNRNHFAQFLSLTLAPLMWWLFSELKAFSDNTSSVTTEKTSFGKTLGAPLLLLLAGTAVVFVGVLLSLSRGGMIAAVAVALTSVVGLWRGFRPGAAAVLVLSGGSLLLLGLLSMADQEQLQTKVDQLLSGDAEQIDTGGNRQAIWAADAKVIRRFPVLGTGVGSHRDVYTLYMENYADFAQNEMTHAESSFVHAALETGLVGVGTLILALVLLLIKLVVGVLKTSDAKTRAAAISVLAAAAGALLHAVVDFIWYVPGIVVVSLVLAAVGLRSVAPGFGADTDTRGFPVPRVGWAMIGGFCLLALLGSQSELVARATAERHYFAALRTKPEIVVDADDGYDNLKPGDAVAFGDEEDREKDEAPTNDPAFEKKLRAAELKFVTTRIRHFQASLQAWPQQHRVQLMLANDLRELFDLLQLQSGSPFALHMLRDAATSSDFQSVTDLQAWLRKVCGERLKLIRLSDRLVRHSLAGCPVQGHAYLALMETAFLQDPANALHEKLIDQAMLVRGYDPRIRFIAGREAMIRDDWQTGIELWKSVFHSSQYFRLNILQLTASQVPAEFFLQQFEPDAVELKDVLTVYDSLNRPRDVNVLLHVLCTEIPRFAPSIEDDDERLTLLMQAYSYARRLEDLELCVKILQPVVDEFPEAFEARYHLGMTLVELERPEDALEHLEWCYEQDPGNIYIPRHIVRARKQLLKSKDESAESFRFTGMSRHQAP